MTYTGYSYARDASVKTAIRNSKRDSVLYGAVFKAESMFPGTATVGTQATSTSTTMGEQMQTPSAPTLAVIRRQMALDATVGPRDSVSNQPSPASSGASKPASNASSIFSEMFESGFTKRLKKIEGTVRPPVQKTDEEKLAAHDVEELRKKLMKPVDSRQPNVSVVDAPAGTPTQTTVTTPPYIFNPAPTVSGDARGAAPGVGDKFPSLATFPLPGDHRGENEEKDGEKSSESTLIQTNAAIQAAAKTWHEFTKKATDQMTPYDSNDNIIPDTRIQYKHNVLLDNPSHYSFEWSRLANKEKGITRIPYKVFKISPSPDEGIDVLKSLNKAIANQKNYKPTMRSGEQNGMGLSGVHVGSDRVVYAPRRNSGAVKKGQLYVLQNQFAKGNLRLYTKSDRPVVSRTGISPSFQRLVKSIIERNTFDAADYSGCESKESADVNAFIAATKPVQPRNIDQLSNADTIWQTKKRYEVLVGELSAGNSGKLVRDEMESILRSLIQMRAINPDKARGLIKSLREF